MEKSRLEPQQVFEWLGIHYNLKKYEVRNTETQIHQFNSQMKAIWEKKTFTKRIIMRLQGLANWLGQVDPLRRTVLSHTKAFLKHLRGVPLDTTLHMNNKLRSLISIWMNLPHTIQRLGIPEPTCIVQSDASLTGYGFKIDQRSYQGNFDRSMRSYSINVLELLTIWMATLMIHKKDQAIRILSDNSTAIASINRASSVVYPLAGLTKMIWKRAAQMNWTITAAHIQGRFNVIADQLSRNTVLSTEWSLPMKVFTQEILHLEPNLQVDLFATSLNNKLETYISPCPDLKACAVDALKTDWSNWDYVYLYPPHQLVLKALHKLIQSNIKTALLITREEPTRHWYAQLRLHLTQLQIIQVRLQQQVGEIMRKETKVSNIRVWRYSKPPTTLNTQNVTNRQYT